MIMKCLKKVKKIFERPVLPYSFSPIDCRSSVMKTVKKTKNEILISNHQYLDNQTDDRLVKVMGFLTDIKVYTGNYDCSMSYIQDFVSESEAKLQSHFLIPNTISQQFTDIITPVIEFNHAQCAPSSLLEEYSYHMVMVRQYGNYYLLKGFLI